MCQWPVLAAVFALFLLLIPLKTTGRVGNSLVDLCHGPLFALLAGTLAWTFLHRTSRRPVWLWALGIWGVCSAWGLIGEGLQHFVGRQPSWHDASANALGADCGRLLHAASTRAITPHLASRHGGWLAPVGNDFAAYHSGGCPLSNLSNADARDPLNGPGNCRGGLFKIVKLNAFRNIRLRGIGRSKSI